MLELETEENATLNVQNMLEMFFIRQHVLKENSLFIYGKEPIFNQIIIILEKAISLK